MPRLFRGATEEGLGMKPKPISPRPSDQLNRRERVWVDAWTRAIAAVGVTDGQATRLADSCLRDFEERFGQ